MASDVERILALQRTGLTREAIAAIFDIPLADVQSGSLPALGGGGLDLAAIQAALDDASLVAPGGESTDPWHVVGAAGEPAFGAGWAAAAPDLTGDDPTVMPVPSFRDIGGAVALRGMVAGTFGPAIFVLPVDYRPSSTHISWVQAQGNPARLQVEPNGEVRFADGATATPTWLSLTTMIPLSP